MKTVFCVFKYALKFFTGCIRWDAFLSFLENVGITGMPKTVEVSSTEMLEAFKENIIQILEAVHQVLEDTPPELAADIATRGILLTGGGSMLFGMDDLIGETTGIQTTAVDDPISAVAIGTGRYTEFIEGKQ